MKRPTRIYQHQQHHYRNPSYLHLLSICYGFQPLAGTIIIYLRCSDCYCCYCLFLYIFVHLFIIDVRGLLEKYPTFGREKETGLLGALDT